MISFILCFVSCSPIQTIEGLERHLSTSYIPLGEPDGDVFSDPAYKDYNGLISDSDKENADFSKCGEFRVEDNEFVRHWIVHFTEDYEGRKFMKGALERANRYIALMSRILKRNDLSGNLAYVPLIESGFRFDAVSSAQAVGYWQFRYETAKDYGLHINNYIDQRMDPELSTKAAAKYLKDLCRTFRSWPLALAAYNMGQKNLSDRIVNNLNSDFWFLVKKGRLKQETANYVPQIMAAIKIAESPYRYGFDDLRSHAPLEYRLMQVPQRSRLSHISERHGFSMEELRGLNPMFLRDEIPGTGRTSRIRVPL